MTRFHLDEHGLTGPDRLVGGNSTTAESGSGASCPGPLMFFSVLDVGACGTKGVSEE